MRAFSIHLAWLAQLFHRRSALPALADPTQARPFIVVLAALAGDDDASAAAVLAQALDGRKGILARRHATVIAVDDALPLGAAAAKARQVLAEEQADLIIWGGTTDKGTAVFLTAPPDEENRPGAFGIGNRLELPATIEAPAADVLHAAVLAALSPHDERQRQLLAELLPDAAAACEAVARRLPPNFGQRQQVTALATFGHVAMAMATVEPAADWHGKAEAVFGAAQKRLPPRDKDPLEEALLLRQRAAALMAKAEKSGTEQAYEDAVAAARVALAALPRAKYPAEWAAEQNRLGLALYKFDLRTGRTDLLKEAIGCFQEAAKLCPRAEQPRRWANITETLAQALQVYGDAMRSVEVLDKSVAACTAVLEVRSREGDTLGWAAAMNTLGTALFLRDKHADQSEHLEQASDCLRQAAEAYRSLGLERLAGLADKNMGHVERLMKARRERRARFDWAQEE